MEMTDWILIGKRSGQDCPERLYIFILRIKMWTLHDFPNHRNGHLVRKPYIYLLWSVVLFSTVEDSLLNEEEDARTSLFLEGSGDVSKGGI